MPNRARPPERDVERRHGFDLQRRRSEGDRCDQGARPDALHGGGQVPLARRLTDVAGIADDVARTPVWVADHLLQADPCGARPDETEMLEAYTALGGRRAT